MLLVLLQFIISALAIVAAGTVLTKFADKIADATGWGRMFVGGLLLAGATSVPELMVDLESIQLNLPDLAVGDLLGSSLFNLLILAILDFSFPSAFRRTAFSPDFLHHALAAVLAITLTSIIGIGISSRLDISIFSVSIFCWAVAASYLLGLRLIFKDSKSNSKNLELNSNNISSIDLLLRRDFLLALLGYIISSLIIMLASPYLVNSAEQIAERSGLGFTFVGTTLLALTTSLPELVSTFTAFKIGKLDLALGNIFGSNAFNMLLFIPLDFAYPGSLLSSVSVTHTVTALSVISAMSIAVMGQLYRKKERSFFSEPSSEVVVAIIFIFLILIFMMSK